jgi:hypothetical protein
MPRLCSDRSRSYPGRPARQAVQLTLDSVLYGNVQNDQAGVSRGHSSSSMRDEGPNPEKEKGPASSVGGDQQMAQGSESVVCQRMVGEHPLPCYGAVAHGNRLVRTRMPGCGEGEGNSLSYPISGHIAAARTGLTTCPLECAAHEPASLPRCNPLAQRDD